MRCLACDKGEYVARYRNVDGKRFWGCSRFPACRSAIDGHVLDDNGELVDKYADIAYCEHPVAAENLIAWIDREGDAITACESDNQRMDEDDRQSLKRWEESPGSRFVERPPDRRVAFAVTRANLQRFRPRLLELPIQSALRHFDGILRGWY